MEGPVVLKDIIISKSGKLAKARAFAGDVLSDGREYWFKIFLVPPKCEIEGEDVELYNTGSQFLGRIIFAVRGF